MLMPGNRVQGYGLALSSGRSFIAWKRGRERCET